MNESDRQRLDFMLQYCDEIAAALERFGADFETFSSDRPFYHAVSMCLLQIGELAKGLSLDYIGQTSDVIPWSSIKGMRDWFAHGYGVMDKRIVWETSVSDVPAMADAIRKSLRQ